MTPVDETVTPLATHIPAAVAAAAMHVLDATLKAEPPPFRRWKFSPGQPLAPIGNYLLGYGYVRPAQLIQALKFQRACSYGETRMLLGDVLIRDGVISPRVLASLLTLQLVDRLHVPGPFLPTRLGEHLVIQGILSPNQLATSLQLQAWLRAQGVRVRLGDLLIQQNLVTPQAIAAAVYAQSYPKP